MWWAPHPIWYFGIELLWEHTQVLMQQQAIQPLHIQAQGTPAIRQCVMFRVCCLLRRRMEPFNPAISDALSGCAHALGVLCNCQVPPPLKQQKLMALNAEQPYLFADVDPEKSDLAGGMYLLEACITLPQ